MAQLDLPQVAYNLYSIKKLMCEVIFESILEYQRGVRRAKRIGKLKPKRINQDYKNFADAKQFIFTNRLDRFIRYWELNLSANLIRQKVKQRGCKTIKCNGIKIYGGQNAER